MSRVLFWQSGVEDSVSVTCAETSVTSVLVKWTRAVMGVSLPLSLSLSLSLSVCLSLSLSLSPPFINGRQPLTPQVWRES